MVHQTRHQLQDLFELMTPYVYFQAPSQMDYPCIKYDLADDTVMYADNSVYHHHDGYTVTIIDWDPDSVLREMIAMLPMCRFDRFYHKNDLNHFVYNLFF